MQAIVTDVASRASRAKARRHFCQRACSITRQVLLVMTAAAFAIELLDRASVGADRRGDASKERQGEKSGCNGFHDRLQFFCFNGASSMPYQ